MSFVIEKDVPIVPKRKGRVSMYPFEAMDVGDSFAISDEKTYSNVRYSAIYWSCKDDRRWVVRKTPDEDDVYARCWRTQ